MNVAVHLHNLGMQPSLVSAVGSDRDGDDLLDFLANQHLSVSHINRDSSYPTGQVKVVETAEDVRYEIASPAAWDHIPLSLEAETLCRNSGLIVFGTLASRSKESSQTLLSLLKHCPGKVLDLNLRPPHYTWSTVRELIQAADILKLNETEFEELQDRLDLRDEDPEAVIDSIRQTLGLEEIVLTRGAEGAMLNTKEGTVSQRAFAVQVRDVVGSGDAFLATWLAARHRALSNREGLRLACAAGAFVAARRGAVPRISWELLEEFIGAGSY